MDYFTQKELIKVNKAKEFLTYALSVIISIAFIFFLFRGLSLEGWISGLLAAALYIGLTFLLKPSPRIGRVKVEALKGGENSLVLMEEAKADLKSLKKNLPAIESEKAHKNVEGLILTGGEILDYLKAHPEKISDAHRFADYYLDMAEKLVRKYIDLQHSGQAGRVAAQTEDALAALDTAFDKQLKRLTAGELMEIETDIKVLQETMKMEGDL